MGRLVAVLADLVGGGKAARRRLARGLWLGYRPQALGGGERPMARLVVARKGTFPSKREVETVERDLRAALLQQAGVVVVSGFVVEWEATTGVVAPGWGAHVIRWREERPSALFGLGATERARARAWLRAKGRMGEEAGSGD